MFKEHTTVDYACRVAGILAERNNPIPAVDIATGISASQSYVCKVLSRMTRGGLLRSGVDGYELIIPMSQLTAGHILAVCHPGIAEGPAARLSARLNEMAHQVPLADIL